MGCEMSDKEVIQSMLATYHESYAMDFTIGEELVLDEVTGLRFYPLGMEKLIDIKWITGKPSFVKVTGGRYFPPDEKGRRALTLIQHRPDGVWKERKCTVVQWVSKKGNLLAEDIIIGDDWRCERNIYIPVQELARLSKEAGFEMVA